MKRTTPRTRLLATLALGTSLALAGCGTPAASTSAGAAPSSATSGSGVDTSPEQTGRPHAEAVAELNAALPQAVRDRGTLVIGTTGSGNPPLSFRADDDETVIGIEPDIAILVAETLGLEPDIRATSWENLFLSVESGQYDAGFSNITVTEERKEKYDFAGYRVDTLAWEVAADSDIEEISGPEDIAGLTVAVGSGTNQEKILLAWDEENQAAGREPVTIQYYQNAADTYLALASGRIEASFGPNPTAAYHAAVAGDTKIVGNVPGGGEVQADIAAMTVKGSGLAQPISDALNHLIADGTYAEVLERWNLAEEAVPTSRVNPPGLPKQG
ncbi:ABC transporter substrate-binding protein [Kineococcus glutinatus]|uniref:ABC transporter substrate-binding protein n=1 Tax=Kineococcus glutinatus TaxID=1070872 RepID=A0ABP9H7C6_9ACTN